MRTSALHVRLGEDCAQAVTTLAQAWGQSVSQVLRDAVHDLLAHPERYAELLAARAPTTFGDSRSPGQAANWLRDKEPLVHMDPALQAVRAENLV